MYKLLPQQDIDKVSKEYKMRRISLMLALVCSVIVFMAVALSPSLIFAREKKKVALFTLASVDQLPASQGKQGLLTWVEKVKSQIASITPDSQPDEPYENFQKIISKKISGISITSLIWNRQPTGVKNLRVSGVASSRQVLLDFVAKLQSSNDWSQADLPVSTIAKETDIPFEVSLTPQKAK
jgi:hypothetical protein